MLLKKKAKGMENNNRGQEEPFLKLAESNEEIGDAKEILERAFHLFFKGSGLSLNTYHVRKYMLWYRHGRMNATSLETYMRPQLGGKSLYLEFEGEQFTGYMKRFLSSFIKNEVEEKHRTTVAYSIYYITTLLLQAEVFQDDDVWGKLLSLQPLVDRFIKEGNFNTIANEIATLLYEYIVKIEK